MPDYFNPPHPDAADEPLLTAEEAFSKAAREACEVMEIKRLPRIVELPARNLFGDTYDRLYAIYVRDRLKNSDLNKEAVYRAGRWILTCMVIDARLAERDAAKETAHEPHQEQVDSLRLVRETDSRP